MHTSICSGLNLFSLFIFPPLAKKSLAQDSSCGVGSGYVCKHLLWYQCATVCRSIAVCCSVSQYLRSWRRPCIQAFALVSIFFARKPPKKARSRFVPIKVAMHKSICSGIDFFPLACNTYTHTHTHIQTHTHAHTYTHTRTHTRAHLRAHTHPASKTVLTNSEAATYASISSGVDFFRAKTPKKTIASKKLSSGSLEIQNLFSDSSCTPFPLFPSFRLRRVLQYGVATISRLLKIIGLFCKRAL